MMSDVAHDVSCAFASKIEPFYFFDGVSTNNRRLDVDTTTLFSPGRAYGICITANAAATVEHCRDGG